jgi:hypothetical protein
MCNFNKGADANIAHGFFYAIQQSLSYLWIVGDDNPISDNAFNSTPSILLGSIDFDAIIGSRNELAVIQKVTSFPELNSQVGTTASFISSTIYRCKFDETVCEKAFRFKILRSGGFGQLAIPKPESCRREKSALVEQNIFLERFAS